MAAHKPLSHLMWEIQTTNSGVHQNSFETVPSLQYPASNGILDMLASTFSVIMLDHMHMNTRTQTHQMPVERSAQKGF